MRYTPRASNYAESSPPEQLSGSPLLNWDLAASNPVALGPEMPYTGHWSPTARHRGQLTYQLYPHRYPGQLGF